MTPVFEITEREDIRAFPQAAVFRQLAAGGCGSPWTTSAPVMPVPPARWLIG